MIYGFLARVILNELLLSSSCLLFIGIMKMWNCIQLHLLVVLKIWNFFFPKISKLIKLRLEKPKKQTKIFLKLCA